MAQDNFKYIIKTELQLNTGSINKLLSQVKEVDKQIKTHFDNARGGGIKVPLSVNADITKLQGEVKRTVDGYNKGQAPHIKIPVSIDESSIKKLQSRISALKNQLNSISNDKKTITVNTSLKVDAGEKAKIQKQVGESKATMTVGLKLNDGDLKAIKTQIESIKADVKASISSATRAIQPQTGRTVGRFNGSGSVGTVVGDGANRVVRVSKGRADRFLSERQSIVSEIRTIKENERLLNAELKELTNKQEIENRIAQLESKKTNPKSKQHDFKDANGNVIKGSRVYAKDYDATIASYKEALKKIDTVNNLKSQLETKQKQLLELERTATYGYRNSSTIRPQHPLAQLNAQLEAERKAEKARQDAIIANQKKIDDDAKKAKLARQREMNSKHKSAEAEDRRIQARKINLVSNKGIKTSQPSLEEIRLKTQRREVESAHRQAEVENRKLQYRQLVAPKTMADAKARFEQRKIESARSQAEIEDRKREAKKINLAREKSLAPKRILNREVETAHAQAIREERKRQAKLFSNANATGEVKSQQQREIDRAHAQALKDERKRQAFENERPKREAEQRKKEQEKAIKQEIDRKKREMNSAHKSALAIDRARTAREEAKRQAEQKALEQAQNNPNRSNNGRGAIPKKQQNAIDYNVGIHRYGANREYQGIDLEARLRNPNIGLKESLGYLNQIHTRNQADAKQSGQNFQRQYEIKYRDNDGHIRSVRTLTYEYTSLGDKIQRGDRSFKAIAGTMMKNIGVYTLFTSGFRMLSQSISKAIQDMVNFDAQLAQVGMITQNLNTGEASKNFKGFGGTPTEIKTAIQEDSFRVGQQYGVSTMGTVLPVESQVLARTNLIKDKNGRISPAMQKQMVDKIIQYSAVSTGGNASAEEVSSISQDVMSLYQAMYTEGETSHMGKIDKLLDYMAIMKAKGVNTNAVTDSMSELAPDVIKKDMDPKQVAGMLGAYNLSDVDATGANMTQIGKLFLGSIAKPNNQQVQKSLKLMGIDPSKEEFNTPKELANAVMARFPTLLQKDQAEVSEGFAGLTGKSSAMTPKMTKFLEAISSSYVKQFDEADKETPNALSKSWATFSDTLKRNFMSLGEQVKELVQQLARLGLMDMIGAVVKGLTGFLNAINGALHGIQKLSDSFTSNGAFNAPKFMFEMAGLALAVKSTTAVMNKLAPGVSALIGDVLQRTTGRRGGFKQVAGVADVVGGTVLANAPVTKTVTPRVVRNATVSTGSYVVSSMIPSLVPTMSNGKPVPTSTPIIPMANPVKGKANLINGAVVATSLLPSMTNRGPINSGDVRTIYGYNAQRTFNSTNTALQQGINNVNNGPVASRGTIIRANMLNAGNSVASGGKRAIGGISTFLGDALMIASLRNGGMRRAGTEVAERSGGAFKAFGEWLKKIGPSLYRFGLILTRLTVVAGALALAWWTVNKVIDNVNKKAKEDYKTTNENLKANSKEMLEDPEVAKHKNAQMDKFISDNIKYMKESTSASSMDNDMNLDAIKRNKKIAKSRKKLKYDLGIEFFSRGNGDDRQDFIKYHTMNADGNMSKKSITANINDKKDMEEFEKARQNGFRGEILTVKDEAKGWAVNTDYVLDYNKALIDANELTKEINRTTKMLGYNIEGIDAKFMGVDSTTSLKQKIDATSQNLGNASDERQKLQEMKDRITKHQELLQSDLTKQIATAMNHGVTNKQVDKIKDDFLLAKQEGNTDTFMDGFADYTEADKKSWKKGKKKEDGTWEVEPMTKAQINSKVEEGLLLKSIAEIVMKLSGLTDATDTVTDAQLQQAQAKRQEEQAIKEYTAQLLVLSSGIGIMEAQISKINSAVGMGRAMVQMADPNSKEQIGAQSSMIKVSSELLKGYRAELSSVTNSMDSIKAQNAGQDFSINYLYNPGENGLSAQQSAYKELLEKQTQIQDSVSSTTVDVYEQAQQLKDMVLNSDKYADMWERVQNRTQLVKDANKEIFDMKNDRAMVGSMSQMRSAITGQNVNEVKQSKLEAIRDRGLDMYEQLSSALNTYGDDAEKLSEAYDEINKTMGTEFDKAFIAPLKDIVSNDFAEAGNKILDGADSLNTVLGNWAQFAMESASNPNSVTGQNAAFDNAMKIPSYNGSGITKDSPMAQKIDAYLEQIGYKKGSKEYAVARKQLVGSMSSSELEKTVNAGITETTNNTAVSEYAQTIDGKLGGKLAGYGNTFAKYGAQYGIDPRFLAAIAMHETGNGTSKAVRDRNNVGGIMGSNGLKNFSSLDEGIEQLASLLKRLYFSQGLNTIPEIQKKYSPVGAANDPNGLNGYWQSGVAKYYSGMTGISTSSLIGGQEIGSSSGTGGTGSSGGTAVSSTRGTVRKGSRGEDVKALQKALGISADGIFGKGTEKAVKAYQKKNGLDADGIVGAKTWSKLGIGNGSTSTNTNLGSGSGSKSAMSVLAGMVGKSPSQGGLTYVWGGGHDDSDWDAFIKKAKADCSGFVQHFFKEFGKYDLGNGSSNSMWQSNDGKKVAKGDLKAGDLVYFGSKNKVTHVGIYAGDGKMYNMTSKGQPLKLSDMSDRKDYVGAKRYDGVNAKVTNNGNTSVTKGQVSKIDIIKARKKSLDESIEAIKDMNTPKAMQDQFTRDASISYGIGNIRDPLGTSGRIAVADRVVQERENVYQKRVDTVEQLKQLGSERKKTVGLANKALKSGNKAEYKEYSNTVKSIDKLIKTLEDTNKKLGDWDKKLSEKQKLDPRLNGAEAEKAIRGGYDKLRGLKPGTPEYMRVANEINEMNGTYMTRRNKSNILGQVWETSGVGTYGYTNAKRSADKEDTNILFDKLKKINGVLNDFAEGTDSWYSVLEAAVAVQEELVALEEKRLSNAKTMFDLTGKGINGYIEQKAYVTDKTTKQNKSNLQTALDKYKSKEMQDTYKTTVGGEYTKKDAEKIKDKIKSKYGVDASIVYDKKTKKYKVTTEGGLSKEKSEEVQKGITKDKVGAKSATSTKVSEGGTMNASEELATLQIIADLQDQLMSGINEYRAAVVGAFKAGAMTLEEYLKKMNDLRDVQNEARENAITLVDTLSQGIQDAFANALSGGMQGNMDSAESFVDSVKQSIASAISSSLASTLLNNTGLLDMVNGFIAKITDAATNGSPDDIANMFKDGNFSEEMKNMLAPFLPLIEEIVNSTGGMFNLMKDQAFNAPEGYKIDQELYNIAKGKGVKDWDPTGKNGSGSPDSPTTGGGGTIVTPPSSGNTGGGSGTNSGSGNSGSGNSGGTGGGASGSTPETTKPGGSKAPSGASTDNPKRDNSTVKSPKAPSKSPSGHKHGTVRKGDRGADVKEIQKAVGVTQDGIFGPQTEKAVKAYQKKHGLTADGIVGTKTWAEIHKGQPTSGGSKGGSTGGGSKSDGNTTYKTTKTSLNFRSSAKTGNNVISVLPKGAKVEYLGEKDGWARVKYKGKTGYVGKSYIYHSGGIAGMMNFASPNKLKPDEIDAVLRQGEKVFTDKQVSSLVGGGSQTNNNGGDVNFNITVNVEGGQNSGALQASVETAVKKAIQEVKRDQRFTNLTWKGTSY